MITLTSKPDKDTMKKQTKQTKAKEEHFKLISLINIEVKFFNKILANWIQQYRKSIQAWSSGIYSRDASMAQYLQINQYDAPHLKNKG